MAGPIRHAHAAMTDSAPPVLSVLRTEPARFTFDAAMRVLMLAAKQARVADSARLRPTASLAYAGSPILSVSDDRVPAVITGLPDLAGSGGVLPLHYAGAIAGMDRGRRLAALLHLLSERMLAALAEAGIKYRMDRAVEAGHAAKAASMQEVVLLALAGFTEASAHSLPGGSATVVRHAGLFALGPRSADRLAAIVADWSGHAVAVEEFVGAWLPIDRGQQTRLGMGRRPGHHAQLGIDAVAGAHAWDQQALIRLRMGPLRLDAFNRLLPGQELLPSLRALIRTYLGYMGTMRINLVLRGDAVPDCRLANAKGLTRLGLDSWLPAVAGRSAPELDDVAFPA